MRRRLQDRDTIPRNLEPQQRRRLAEGDEVDLAARRPRMGHGEGGEARRVGLEEDADVEIAAGTVLATCRRPEEHGEPEPRHLGERARQEIRRRHDGIVASGSRVPVLLWPCGPSHFAITLVSYADKLFFGLIATKQVSNLELLSTYVQEAFTDLEAAILDAHTR